jgi:hypothetical protein
MLDTAAENRLQHLFRRENRSLLQYVRQASPWVAEQDRDRLKRVMELADAEFEVIGELGALLEEWHIPQPYLGAFPGAFTNYNFIALRTLLPKLIDDHRRGVAELERDAAALNGPQREAIAAFLEAKRKHLAELESL